MYPTATGLNRPLQRTCSAEVVVETIETATSEYLQWIYTVNALFTSLVHALKVFSDCFLVY